MIFNTKRRQLQEKWKQVIVALTNARVTEISDEARSLLSEVISSTSLLYGRGNKVNRATIKIIGIAKRLLADKRAYDAIKCIDYLIAAHSVLRSRIDKAIKDRVMAHFLQMGNLYLILMIRKQESNPCAPGEMLRKVEDRNEPN